MREPVDADRLRAFMRALAGAARGLWPGCRRSPARDSRDQESLNVNVELASPADFMPVKPSWEDRSPFTPGLSAVVRAGHWRETKARFHTVWCSGPGCATKVARLGQKGRRLTAWPRDREVRRRAADLR